MEISNETFKIMNKAYRSTYFNKYKLKYFINVKQYNMHK